MSRERIQAFKGVLRRHLDAGVSAGHLAGVIRAIGHDADPEDLDRVITGDIAAGLVALAHNG